MDDAKKNGRTIMGKLWAAYSIMLVLLILGIYWSSPIIISFAILFSVAVLRIDRSLLQFDSNSKSRNKKYTSDIDHQSKNIFSGNRNEKIREMNGSSKG